MYDLMDYKTRSKECYGDLSTIIAHTSLGTHLPNVWDDNTNTCYYPEGAEFILIKESPNGGYSVKTMPMPNRVLDWKK